jgi:hypothetical protein
MKHLFTGVAIAAVLAISAPAWAQNAPMKPAAPAASKPAAAAPMAKKPMAKRVMHRRMHASADHDSMTEQLNRQELARIQGGGAGAGAGPAPMAPDRMSGPKVGPK